MASSVNASKHKHRVSGKDFPGIKPQILAEGLERDQKDGRYEDNLCGTVQCSELDSAEFVVSERETVTISFYSGNPRVEGIIQESKKQMTYLTDEAPRSKIICVLAAPAFLTIYDIVQLTAPMAKWINYVRITCDASNEYMVLVEFKSADLADEFYLTYNEKEFNAIEEQKCLLKYVDFVEGGKPTVDKICTICFGRLDKAENIVITLLCAHTFHASCLDLLTESCPACGFFKNPEMEPSKCLTCNEVGFHLCLTCGGVGCARHAHLHFQKTQHTYALQVGRNKVWDYAGGNSFHLLLPKDGENCLTLKELDLLKQLSTQKAYYENKSRTQAEESQHSLIDQHESQKAHYEEIISGIEREALSQRLLLESRLKEKGEECEKYENQVQNLLTEKSMLEKKFSQVESKLQKEINEEKEMNNCLRLNQKEWQDKVSALESSSKAEKENHKKEVAEYQEQLRDMMLHLETQNKIEQMPAGICQDIQKGQIMVGSASGTSKSKPAEKHRKKKRGSKK